MTLKEVRKTRYNARQRDQGASRFGTEYRRQQVRRKKMGARMARRIFWAAGGMTAGMALFLGRAS